MDWVWNAEKNLANKRKHGLSFEIAVLVFDDPLMASRPDPHSDGDRWQTLGLVEHVMIFLVHTEPRLNPVTGRQSGRLISARRATSLERRAYEEGDF
jgi:uncharacterized DUF497 family protein